SRTTHDPTAPPTTTATKLPGLTPALTAAWWPVHITSESARNDRIISSECLVPGTGTSVLPARGTRTACPWPPSILPSPNAPPATHCEETPARQGGHVPSQYLNGAITRSPPAMPRTSAPASSTTPMNSCPIEPVA